MKKLLLLLLISLCAIGWRSETIMQTLGLANALPEAETVSIESLIAQAGKKPDNAMSLSDYADRAGKDPDAYRKLLQSYEEEPPPRSQIDKLMNFFAHLKYE